MIPDEPTPFVKVIRLASEQHPEVWREEQTAPTLNSFDNAGESRATVLACGFKGGQSDGGIGWEEETSPTLNSQMSALEPTVLVPTAQVRRLTPTECERLMGWPDGHTATRADGSTVADSTRYRMCGNGVVSNVAEWIAGHIAAALEEQ